MIAPTTRLTTATTLDFKPLLYIFTPVSFVPDLRDSNRGFGQPWYNLNNAGFGLSKIGILLSLNNHLLTG